MTPIKPRPFPVVLATTVASQDGVVAAGDSVRNCRTRPSAEQRLLPVIGHPIPGKCEPRFNLSTTRPPWWSPARQARYAENDWGPPEAAGPGSAPADYPRHLGLLGSAWRPSCPFPTPDGLDPDELSLPTPTTTPPRRRPLPSCHLGFLPVEFPRTKRKAGVPGLRAASPQRGKEEKKDSAKCPEEEPGGEGERGRSLSQGRF